MKCSFCKHEESDHCKGFVRHVSLKAQKQNGSLPGENQVTVCSTRHCLQPLCCCTRFKKIRKKDD